MIGLPGFQKLSKSGFKERRLVVFQLLQLLLVRVDSDDGVTNRSHSGGVHRSEITTADDRNVSQLTLSSQVISSASHSPTGVRTKVDSVKRFTDFLVNSLPALLIAVAAVVIVAVGIVAAVIFPGTAAVVIGLIVIVAGLIVLAGTVGIGAEWARTQNRIDTLNAEIAEARRAENTIYYAAELPEDDQPDAPAAQKLLETFAADSPLMENLRIDRGQDLPAQGVAQLDGFLSSSAKQSFSDAAVHSAFMSVFRAARDLREWLKAETAEADGILSITPGDAREGGWREFSAAAARGDVLAQDLLTARSAFERAALEADLL